MNNPQFPTARNSGLVVQEVPNEILVFDLENNKAHCLNDTAAMVWKSCDGKTSVPEIAKYLEIQTGKGVNDDLVWLAIDQLSENHLLEKTASSPFKGQSRRDVIKKIGLASVIAIPVVASLVAPQSVLANVSCVCTSSTDCGAPGFGTCASLVCCNAAGICAPALPAPNGGCI
ncbi:MAG: hypothetical protein DMF62_05880 [Acidobacteria bacterium]|nr:MAG: hypothetical protein DMF62_05880 [Acidobacteriota bacterium]